MERERDNRPLLRKGLFERGPDSVRGRDGALPFYVHEAQGCVASHEGFGFLLPMDRVLDGDANVRKVSEGNFDDQGIVVVGGASVANIGFYHRHDDAVGLKVAIRDPKITKRLRPSGLEVVEVVRVVDDAHGIAFAVPNTVVVRIDVGHDDTGQEENRANAGRY